MKYDSNIHHRRSVRLKFYDYSHNGRYFVTICTEGKQCIFEKIFEYIRYNPQKWNDDEYNLL